MQEREKVKLGCRNRQRVESVTLSNEEERKMRYRNQTKSNIENQRNKETKRIKRKYDDESFELSKMACVESYGGLGQELRGVLWFSEHTCTRITKRKSTPNRARGANWFSGF